MVMTDFSNTTRFALACNDSSKLIEPIQSRCAIVRFTKLTDEEMLKRLHVVVKSENFNCQIDGYESIIFTAEGDMRYALNNLQATAAGFEEINKENVFKVCDQPHPELMENVIRKCLKSEFSECCKEIDLIYNEGFNIVDIINTLTRVIQNMGEFKNEELRLGFLKEASVVKMRVIEGNGSHL
jgi:replication factor C subunit 2/4